VPSRDPQPATTQPRWWERARGLAGIAGLVTVMGVGLAVLIGIALVILAIAIISTLG
jgi:hypothetical protein